MKIFIRAFWQIPAKFFKRFFIFWTCVLLSAWKGFNKHQSYLKASLLTYYTLFSIVPVLAVAFGIAKGFGFEKYFKDQLYQRFHEHENIVRKAVEFSHQLLLHTQESVIVAIGAVTLFWTVLMLVGNIEFSLNEIWNVKKERTFPRKVTDYFTLIIFCPFFFVFSTSVAFFFTTQFAKFTKETVFEPLIPAVTLSLRLVVPLVISWLLFSFIYIVVPNTRVRLKYGFVAGIFGGTIYQGTQWIYITFQVGVSDYGAIYGSFAALPLFLTWVNLSWLIFLLGAEIGYFAEEKGSITYLYERGKSRHLASPTDLAVLLTFYCIQAFCREESPIKLKELSNRLQISYSSMKEIADTLVSAKILSIISCDSDTILQPAKAITAITLNTVIAAMNSSLQEKINTIEDESLQKVQETVKQYDLGQMSLKENILLKTLLE